MYLLVFLIIFPSAAALLLLLIKKECLRSTVVKISSFCLFGATLGLLFVNFSWDVQFFKAHSYFADKFIFYLELFLAGYIFYAGIKYRRPLTWILISAQALIMIWFELFLAGGINPEFNLFVDKLSIMMASIVGVIGGLTCLYSIGYMKEFHEQSHREVKDSRGFFFFVIFIFLSAMYGIVFCNNLKWLYFFWEITTLCSFLLIGYKRTPEARKNSFLALELNLLGGLAFSIAIVYLYFTAGIIEMDKLMAAGKAGVMIPVALIVFSGLIKSAQLPFSSWLVGAMVAPVPVSALLHASTMVKAGVYIMLRLVTTLQDTMAGYMLALVGAVTFLVCAFIAVSETHAKKVLAYSTVSNLGLIALCAGVGTSEAMWAAMLLIIFHALAKGLLFLCVGTVEQKIKSMDIEDMSGLVVRMPKLSIMMQVAMAGMFLAPFGMLIGKWAALQALVDYNPILAVFVVFGSSITVFFWIKWMGKLIIVERAHNQLEQDIALSEWMPLFSLSALTAGVCLFFPLICSIFIEPYLIEIYGVTVDLGHGNVVIMTLMLAVILLFPLSFINYGKRVRVVDAYLGAANAEGPTQFRSRAKTIRNMEMRNYYLQRYFGEARLFKVGALICAIFIIAMLGVSLI